MVNHCYVVMLLVVNNYIFKRFIAKARRGSMLCVLLH
jgi:hypothetical protein